MKSVMFNRLHSRLNLIADLRRGLFGIAVTLLLAASTLLHAQDDEEPPPPPRDLTELQQQLQAEMSEQQIPAIGVALVRGGQLEWAGGLGVADQISGRAADEHTLFRIGSISKALLALAVMREVEAGRMDLQASVSELAPEIPIDNPWQATDPVRLVHLLEHTAGFDDMHFQRMERDPEAADTLQQMVQFAPEFRVRWRPGERQSYSNPGYGLVAYLLEKATGRDAKEYVSAEVLVRLGMLDTRWDTTEADERIAVGYETGSTQRVPESDLSMPTVGALWSSPADMARLLQFHLSGTRSAAELISPASLRRIETPMTSLASKAGFKGGYALANYVSDIDGWRLRGHSGGLPGYLAYLAYQPEQQFGFVVMMNTIPERSRPLRELLVSYLSQDLSKPVAAERIAPDPQWEGWYGAANSRNQILAGIEGLMNVGRISVDDGGYRISHPLLPESFQFDLLPGAQTRDDGLLEANGVFTLDADGRAVWVSDDNVFVRSSFWQTAVPLYLAALALASLALSLLCTPVWAWRQYRGKLAGYRGASARYWPAAAALAFVAAVFSTFNLSLTALTRAEIDAPALGVFLGTLAFGVLALIGLVQVWRHRKNLGGRFVTGLSLSASFGAVGLALWLWRIELLGVRLWAW
jgi:CubicO group peptidase (beta-lactamase class C family)